LLRAGACAITEIPDDRWAKDRFYDPRPGQPGKSYTFAAGCLDDASAFDPAFFGMSPREVIHVDPQQRLMLELVQEALEDAGLPVAGLGQRKVGVYVGGSSFDYSVKAAGDVAASDVYSMQGGALSSLSNRISYVYDLHGPSFTVDTACSSSMVALHQAAEALRRGEIGMAIVGGVNMLLTPQPFVGFARASMLSPTGRCHAFDARADGYVRSEGGGALILVPLADAMTMGAEIHAVLAASGVNSDGRTQGFSLPNGTAQATLLRQVYGEAGISPDALGYFEAHGTGTPVGDPIEADAIGRALGQRRNSPLPVGSVKPNVGHLEAASAMASLMKALIIMRSGQIPRSLLNETPNPRIPFDDLNLTLIHAPVVFPAGSHIGVNSFGFGGTNAHAVLGPPPARPSVVEQDAPLPPLLLSAHSSAALRALAAEWSGVVSTSDRPRLAASIRGAARGRDHHAERAVLTATDGSALVSRLDALADGGSVPGLVTGQAVKGSLAFVFSGNGSQWAGMAQDALALSPDFTNALTIVDAALAPRLGWSVAARLAIPDSPSLRDTSIAQPLLFAVQVALTLALRGCGVVPTAVVGHSAGEVAAAFTAGALTLDQAAWVIAARSHHQQATHGTGRMAALGLGEVEATTAIATIDPGLEISAVNAPGSVTIAGPQAAVGRLVTWAQAHGIPCYPLDLEYAFHSRAMDPIKTPLLAELDSLVSAKPVLSLVSSVTGDWVTDGSLGADYWWRNVRQPVMFAPAMAHLVAGGARILVEIGPQPVLQPYLRDALRAEDASGRHFGTLSKDPLAVDPIQDIVARCHAAGFSIGDTRAFDGARTVRGLPGTQWQRQSYALVPTAEAIPVVDPAHDHPLLGFRDGTVPGRWHSHIAADLHPWLADHVVAGKAVMPAAGMIDMALAAAAALHPDAPALEIQGLEISQFLPLDPGATRECSFVVEPDGRFQLASRPRMDDAPPSPHATGRLLAGTPGARRAALPIAAGSVIEADAIYAIARAHQLDYGPAFRTVRRVVTFGADEARVALAPANDLPAEAGWLLHPGVVDGALHALIAFAAGATDAEDAKPVLVPWRFGRIVLLRPEGGMPTSARLRIRRRGPRSLAADISLSDASGAVLVELLDCWFVRMPQPQPHRPAQFFRTDLCPATVQAVRPAIDAAALLPADAAPRSASTAFANAFFTAVLVEGLTAIGDLPADALADPMLRHALDWLEADDVATPIDGQWRLHPDLDLPGADDLWRTLFYEVPGATAELAAAGMLASRLNSALRPMPGSVSADAGKVISTALLEQMLTASDTAMTANAALSDATAGFLAIWPRELALRVAIIGHVGADLAARLVDSLTSAVASTYIEIRVLDESVPTLQDALADRTVCAVVALGSMPSNRFDLVVSLWTLGGPAPSPPAAIADLLAPAGTLIAVELTDTRLISLLRQTGGWNRDGRDAEAAAADLAACGLSIFGPQPLGGEIWEAALLTATAPRAPMAAVALERPCFIVGTDLPAWTDALRTVLPSAVVLSDDQFAPHARFAGADIILVLHDCSEAGQLDLASDLARTMADLARMATALDEVPDVRLLLVAREDPAGNVLAAASAAIRHVIANETTQLTCRAIRIDPALPLDAAIAALIDERAAADEEPDVVLTPAGRLVPRLHAGLPSLRDRGIPAANTAELRLDVGRPGLLASLRWQTFTPRPPATDEVEIEVAAAGLNFRDVMWTLGLLPDEALLDGFSGPALGLECAGIVRSVGSDVTDLQPGDRVIAMAPASLATSVVTRRHAVLLLPDGLDLVAATTMPVAFMTAVYSLGHVGRLRAGERVLIHGGAGGVGLAAIQYALHRGAVVYATAGDPARRALLSRLGVTGVFDSRSARFFDDVLAATAGEGVDVVLNSLSGELMTRSLDLLRPFGRFLEIGKRDLYENTAVGIRPLRHNISYFAIDVDELASRRPVEAAEVMAEIALLMADGHIRPLPFRRYGYSHAAAAFRQMQASGHVGKIVLVPDHRDTGSAPSMAPLSADGTYLVTGGLSGFGLQTAHWLVAHGARRLALVSRRGGATPGADIVLASFAAGGVAATAHACDVTDPVALARTLAAVRALGAPLSGVVHAAMVIDDAALAQQDAARFQTVIAPKLAGAAALDALTRDDPIDLFILFSSITTALGNPGQANYVVANAALEAIAVSRQSVGLPGLAVCWGPIGDAGYLTGAQRVADMLEKVMGARHLTAAEALAALPDALATGAPVLGIANVRWESVAKFLPRIADKLMAGLPASTQPVGDTGALRAELIALPVEEAQARMVDILRQELASILRLQLDSLTADREISDLGVDSLMAVELRTALETRLGIDLPTLNLASKPTLRVIAARLLKSVLAGPEEATQANKRDQVAELVQQHEDLHLTEDAAQ